MELTDVEYMDELCCGIENKLGASVPHCLLRPMFDNFNAPPRYTSSSGGKSFNRTPPGSVEMLAASQWCSTPEVHQRKHDGKMAPGLEEEDMHGTSPTDDVTLRHLSPVKQLVVKHDKLQESCHKLKTSMVSFSINKCDKQSKLYRYVTKSNIWKKENQPYFNK